MLHFSRWSAIAILGLSFAACLLALVNFVPASSLRAAFGPLAERIPRIVLGLDLQGGSHILLQVDTGAVRRDRVNDIRDEVRRIALEQPRINLVGPIQVQGDVVSFRVRDEAQFAVARQRLQTLAQPLGSALALGATVREIDVQEPQPGAFQLRLTEPGLNERVRAAVDQSIEIVRRRVNQIGTVEPFIARQGRDRILVQVPGLQDPEQLKRLLGQTAKLTFRLVDSSMSAEQAAAGRAPPDSEVLQSRDGSPVLVYRQVMVAGEDLADAQPGFDQRTNEPIVSFRFNGNGARRFAATTQENVGRPFAIVLDNQVISAPVIREPILGGAGQISGSFTAQTATELAVLLRAGALPAPLNTVEERTVGPSLGRDSIEAGVLAGYVATALVVGFMLAMYGLFGVFAVLALVVNVLMMIAVQSIIGVTLTLPGIAGIILTIGMAVDSNVVIFERIRDEAREGRSPITAIDKGFSFALGTILDANVTSFVTALLLFLFGGSGPVRGFAVTFMIGIVTTMFTAYTFTRLIIVMWLGRRRVAALPI
jgi:preprotein translocase subunit SecD